MAKPKLLVEIISLSQRLSSTLATILAEAKNTFIKKQDHFAGQLRSYETKIDDGIVYDSEDTLLVTNVKEKLEYVLKTFTESVNANLTKENTNSIAKADIVVNDDTWATGVPVNAILAMETATKKLRDVVLDVPTLEPKEEWKPSKEHAPALFESEPKLRNKTKKVERFQIITEATPQHKAQYEKVMEDIVEGIWTTTLISGKIPPSVKSEMLARIDKLSGVFQNAREVANTTVVSEMNFADKIASYVMEPLNNSLK